MLHCRWSAKSSLALGVGTNPRSAPKWLDNDKPDLACGSLTAASGSKTDAKRICRTPVIRHTECWH
ncbi:hypothetical protein HMPREF0591_1691 [Mycobacterium parascrofulaceum ATCC BAA-614]|uniref:Uncharacterized protein n=1 Tax=Mycobacterium parascrofulaceum ATCC BAA-614 TaxID=525368 RepID=D5P697_9MYCO|nr:hypothetical protein HMPREF0591_1691 [Mycobacterium parascrofulaceum ATCC BAA-614]